MQASDLASHYCESPRTRREPIEGRADFMLPRCPACESEIPIDDLDVDPGVIISCTECGVELRVVGIGPIELELAPDEEAGEWGES